MVIPHSRSLLGVAAGLLLWPTFAAAQARDVAPIIRFAPSSARAVRPARADTAADSTADSTKTAPTSKAPAVDISKLDFSGVLYAHYQYSVDDASKNQNKFDIERVYLTFQLPLGERARVRATTDIFQNTSPSNTFYRGWALRLKYAYLQYDYIRPTTSGFSALARVGLLHTVAIDYVERFWPRWLGITPVERAGFFSSADAGVATLLTLPHKAGEMYVTVTNGPGYTAPENDRFKDYSARLTLTPLASRTGWAQTLSISPWYYKGTLASQFVDGGPGEVGPVGSGLQRDRWGIFAGVRDRRLTLGTEYDQRKDEFETGDNTLASPRQVGEQTGRLLAGFVVTHPVELFQPGSHSPFGLVVRLDDFKPNTDADAKSQFLTAGAFWELTPAAWVALDYQSLTPKDGLAATKQQTWFVHVAAAF